MELCEVHGMRYDARTTIKCPYCHIHKLNMVIDDDNRSIKEMKERYERLHEELYKQISFGMELNQELVDCKQGLANERRLLDKARGALADIHISEDMTLELARNKAKRIYEETELTMDNEHGGVE